MPALGASVGSLNVGPLVEPESGDLVGSGNEDGERVGPVSGFSITSNSFCTSEEQEGLLSSESASTLKETPKSRCSHTLIVNISVTDVMPLGRTGFGTNLPSATKSATLPSNLLSALETRNPSEPPFPVLNSYLMSRRQLLLSHVSSVKEPNESPRFRLSRLIPTVCTMLSSSDVWNREQLTEFGKDVPPVSPSVMIPPCCTKDSDGSGSISTAAPVSESLHTIRRGAFTGSSKSLQVAPF